MEPKPPSLSALSLSLSISPTALKRKENWATKDNRKEKRRGLRAQRVITSPTTDERDYPHYPSRSCPLSDGTNESPFGSRGFFYDFIPLSDIAASSNIYVYPRLLSGERERSPHMLQFENRDIGRNNSSIPMKQFPITPLWVSWQLAPKMSPARSVKVFISKTSLLIYNPKRYG